MTQNNTDRYADRVRVMVKPQEVIQVKPMLQASLVQYSDRIMRQIHDINQIITIHLNMAEAPDASNT
jgi:hypothetical protein